VCCATSGRTTPPHAPPGRGDGRTTNELMRRLGHSSLTAALLYQHAADDRHAEIARALDAMLGAVTEAPERPD
jgi:hypothetical protein